MTRGEVNSRLEAMLNVVVYDSAGTANQFAALIDTGFGGFLTLPVSAIRSFQLRSLGRQRGTLADGSFTYFDVFAGSVEWNGEMRSVEIHAADAEPLIGMKLLEGHTVKIDVRQGGTVEIGFEG